MGTHELVQKFNPQKYIKLIIMIAGALASALAGLSATGGHLAASQLVNVAIAGVAAFQVWYVTETSDNPNGKAVIAFVAAGLTTLASFLTTGVALSPGDWAQILVAALTATGLLALPTSSIARKALPASYANNTLVINAGTTHAQTIDAPTQLIPRPVMPADIPPGS